MRANLVASLLAAVLTAVVFASCRDPVELAPATPGPMNNEALVGDNRDLGLEAEDPGTGGSGDAGVAGRDAGLTAPDAGVTARPTRGPHYVNVDGGSAGMNAGGRVNAVPAPRATGLQNLALDAGTGTGIFPGSQRPEPTRR